MRRWYAALGVAFTCVLFTVGASSLDAGAPIGGRDTPKVLSATAATLHPTALVAPSPQPAAPAFGSYAVVGLETMLAAALLCYAFLQLRRATRVRLLHWVVRLRGPPIPRDCIVFAP